MYPAINFYTNNQIFSDFLNDKATSANIQKIRQFYDIEETKKKLVNNADNGKFNLVLETKNDYIYDALCLGKDKERLEKYAREMDETFKNYFTNQKQNINITCDCGTFYKLKLDFSKKTLN